MWKELACLLFLVTVPPIPGQPPNKSANGTANPKDNSGTQKKPTQQITTAPIGKPGTTKTEEKQRTEELKGDDPIGVATVKPLDVRADVLKDWMDRLNWVFTGALVLIGGGGVYAAVRTLKAIEKQANLMEKQATEARESAAQQMRDVQASIAEATRSSKAMEGIAESMASNVESVRESVGISREIADTQKLVTELQSRPYLSAAFNTAIFQDGNHVFEVQALLRNHGNTPAYDVTFRAVAQIVPIPLPEDFAFSLPNDAAGASSSLMAPGMTKLLTRRVSSRVPDDQIDSIKLGDPPRGLAMWGLVKYRDAFMKNRQLRFAFTVTWLPWVKGMEMDKDGNIRPEQIFSHDTTHHNDSD
jgi:hypothetical protein